MTTLAIHERKRNELRPSRLFANLLDVEKKAIRTTLDFAKLGEIKSDAQVISLFNGLIDFREFMIDSPKAGGARWLGVSLVQHFADLQHRLKSALSRIATSSVKGRRKIVEEIAPGLAQTDFAAFVLKDGKLRFVYDFQSVDAVCVFALATILNEERRLANRLKQCGSPKCGAFNLDQDRMGRPRRFCSAECKKEADRETGAERLREYRKRIRLKEQKERTR
jgi:hypothetical protein